MRKYPAGQSVGAIYDNAPADNPFLAAMPEMVGRGEFLAEKSCLIKGSINPLVIITVYGFSPES